MLKTGFSSKEEMIRVCHALSTDVRVAILELLKNNNLSVIEISNQLDIPFSTASSNVKVLENAGLLITELHPGKRGVVKVCSKNFFDILICLNNENEELFNKQNTVSYEMPIGQFIDYQVDGSCGMCSENGIILEDDPTEFFTPERMNAELLWLRQGFISYNFPKKKLPDSNELASITFSMELCSEVANFNEDWPSDITFSINDFPVCTWTSPGDFGQTRGKLNPDWWESNRTQYGLLKHVKVSAEGTFLENRRVSDVTLQDLKLDQAGFIKLTIGIAEDAVNKGGINLFGKKFGNYEQAIEMILTYQ